VLLINLATTITFKNKQKNPLQTPHDTKSLFLFFFSKKLKGGRVTNIYSLIFIFTNAPIITPPLVHSQTTFSTIVLKPIKPVKADLTQKPFSAYFI
jgi:hypothetical protein